MDYKKVDEPSDELKSGILMLLTPTADSSHFSLYREGRGLMMRMTPQEAANLAEELGRLTAGKFENQRVVVPNLEKPRKVTRPTR